MTPWERAGDGRRTGRLVGRAGGWRLVHIEADDAEDAVQGSIEALRGLGDWTEGPGELCAFPYVEYGNHAGAMELARAVIDRERRPRGPHRHDGGSGRGPGVSGCVEAVE